MIFTLIAETFLISKYGKAQPSRKVFVIVAFANLLSFLAPYCIRAYQFIPVSMDYQFLSAFEKGPFYIVLLGYLLLTLIVEIPVVYVTFKKTVKDKKKLFFVILFSNVITTAVVAITERILCHGSW